MLEIGIRYFTAASELVRVIQEGGRFAIEFYPGSSDRIGPALAAFKKSRVPWVSRC